MYYYNIKKKDRDEMLDLQKGFQQDMDKNEKSETQEKNWTTLANLRKVMRKYKNELIALMIKIMILDID